MSEFYGDDTEWETRSGGSSKRWVMGLTLLLMLAVVTFPTWKTLVQREAKSLAQNFNSLPYQRPGVVHVKCWFAGQTEPREGSGFFLNSRDLLTNLHVVQDLEKRRTKIEVWLHSGTKEVEVVPAELVLPTSQVDLDKPENLKKDWALLRLTREPERGGGGTLFPVSRGAELKKGARVQAIGFPLGGFFASKAQGPNISRERGELVRTPDKNDPTYLIEHDADCDQGFEGGPLVFEGTTVVVGITTGTPFYAIPMRSLPDEVLERSVK